MDFLDLTLPTPEANLALDEALLLEAEAGQSGELLRVWELADCAVVLGSAGQLAAEVNESACRADRVAILRRCSGGGAVVLGPGCFCFSLVLSYERPPVQDVTHSYTYILERLGRALRSAVGAVERAGSSDLAVANRKISGNSQRRMRSFILHHGTILYDFDFSAVERYLKMPPRQPAYRESRTHEAFLANLPQRLEQIKRRLSAAWEANTERDDWPQELVGQLIEEKYSREEWIRRR
jgi:lipoate-protein ligase A